MPENPSDPAAALPSTQTTSEKIGSAGSALGLTIWTSKFAEGKPARPRPLFLVLVPSPPVVRVPAVRDNRKLGEECGLALAEFNEVEIGRTEAHDLKAYKASEPKKDDYTGGDLKVPTTRTNSALLPSFNAQAPRRITEEERGFDIANALCDVKLRAAEVIDPPQ
ncbi:hypothetical protein BDM02DRAFT_3268181 [Thelephora ganbajun]|uniref:Uncharacterized protein n=1 Tax=Thelephora ganbajun TaxID=370292 RepID=A0ACB6ZL33_THEGA|nr:hypothetical protein BDM02DRAFT_3268181 [Thelephora ganbajun]